MKLDEYRKSINIDDELDKRFFNSFWDLCDRFMTEVYSTLTYDTRRKLMESIAEYSVCLYNIKDKRDRVMLSSIILVSLNLLKYKGSLSLFTLFNIFIKDAANRLADIDDNSTVTEITDILICQIGFVFTAHGRKILKGDELFALDTSIFSAMDKYGSYIVEDIGLIKLFSMLNLSYNRLSQLKGMLDLSNSEIIIKNTDRPVESDISFIKGICWQAFDISRYGKLLTKDFLSSKGGIAFYNAVKANEVCLIM